MQFSWQRLADRFSRQVRRRPAWHLAIPRRWRPTLERLEDRQAPATAVWTGTGINNLWSTAGNWQEQILPQPGDDLVFPIADKLTNFNDLQVATVFHSITFTTGGYTINGAVLLLTDGITTTNLSGTNTLNFFIGLQGSQTFTSSFAGSVLTFSQPLELGSSTLTVTGSGATNFNSSITGTSSALVKNGVGRLTLAGTNNFYFGSITINEGELVTSNSLGLGNQAGTTTVNPGATLGINSGVTTAEAIIVSGSGFGGTGAINLIGNSATITGSVIMTGDTTIGANVAGQTLVITGAISELGANFNLTKVGLGNLRLDTPNLFTGTTTVNGGTLQLFQNGTLQSPVVTVNLGSTLLLDNSANVVPDRILDDTPILLNASTLAITGRSTFTVQERVGTITVGQGANFITTNSNITSGSFLLLESPAIERMPGATVQFNQGTLALGTLNATQGNRILLDNPPTLTNGILPFASVNATTFATYGANGIAAQNTLVNGIAAGGATSNVRITNNETVTSSKTINSLTAAATTGRTITLNSGVTLTIGSGGLLNAGAGAITFTGPGVVNFSSPDYGEAFLFDNAAVTINNAITGALMNGLTKSGANTTTFGGANAVNGYTGTTFVNAGALNLSKNATILAIPGDLVIGAGAAAATVTLVNNSSFQIASTAALTILGNGTLNLNNRSNTFAALTMQGGNANASLLTGATGIAALEGDITIEAPLTSSFTQAGRSLIGAGATTIGGTLQLGSLERTFTIADGAPVNDLEILSVVTNAVGGVGLVKEGPGVLLLRANNTYNGATQINEGTLVVNGNQPLTAVTVNAGANLAGGVANVAGTVLNPLVLGTLRPGQVPGPNQFAGPPNGATQRTQGTLVAQGMADFTQGGELVIEIAGFVNQLTDFDRLLVGGALNLNATSVLTVDLQGLSTTGKANGVLTYASRNGTFGMINVINNPNNYTVILTYNDGSIDITVESTLVPAPRSRLAVAPANKGKGLIQVYHPRTQALLYTINAFPGKTGVTLASGDVNGDGINDIVAAQGGRVRVFDGKTGLQVTEKTGLFRPFGAYNGRVFLAAGDLNNDGLADIVAGRGTGPSRVKAVSGKAPGDTDPLQVLVDFRAYEAKFLGGVRVGVGDLDPQPGLEIVTAPGPGRNADVRVFDIDKNQLAEFQVYAAPYKRGVFLALGDLNDDGLQDLVVAPGGTQAAVPIRILDGNNLAGTPLAEFFPFLGYQGPVQVGITDADGDGFLDVAAARVNGSAQVNFFDRNGQALSNLQTFGPGFKGGLFLAASRRP